MPSRAPAGGAENVAEMEFGNLDWLVVDEHGQARSHLGLEITCQMHGSKFRTDSAGRLTHAAYVPLGLITVRTEDGITVTLDPSAYRGKGKVVVLPKRKAR